MATQTLYEGPCELQINGRTLAEAVSARITVRSNSSPVRTMKRGLSGRSRGPAETTIAIESAIPKSGFELDFMTLLVADADITVTWIAAGKRRAIDGWIDGDDETFGVQAAASTSITIMGGKPRIY